MTYTAYLHTHVFLVVSYAVLFLVKLAFLLYNAQGRLDNFRRRTRILEMILPALFLFTGIMLALKSNAWTDPWFLAKMIALLMVIVLGIQTFKRNSRALGVLTLILFIYIFAVSYQKTPRLVNREARLKREMEKTRPDLSGVNLQEKGHYLFTSMGCDKCHGEAGDKGYAGAADLRSSTLGNEQVKDVIANGRKNMPAYGEYFDEEDMSALVVYLNSLRK